MATGDLDYLRAVGAEMLSSPSYSQLRAPVQAEVDAFINEAYRECFLRPDGRRTSWGKRTLDFLFPAEINFTATFTAGSAVIGSPSETLSATYAGSKILIGTQYYTYAGAVSGTHYLATPYGGTTGSMSATFYHSSYALPLATLEVDEEPSVVGKGRLLAINGEGAVVRGTSYASDRWSTPEPYPMWYFGLPLPAEEIESGEPVFYYIDDADLAPNAAASTSPTLRFMVYPLPASGVRAVRVRAAVLPALLTNGTDMPYMKAGAVIDILLPMFRAKLAMGSRRYAGGNMQALMAAARIAERKLVSLDRGQRQMRPAITTKEGY